MPWSEAEMFSKVATTVANSTEPLALLVKRISLSIFLRRIRKILTIIKFGDESSKIKKMLNTKILNHDIIEKISFIGASSFTYTKDGSYKVSPKII